MQETLSCLVVNLYPGNEGYSLMLRGKNGSGKDPRRQQPGPPARRGGLPQGRHLTCGRPGGADLTPSGPPQGVLLADSKLP